MIEYVVEFLDANGQTARKLLVACSDILEAHRLAHSALGEAVFIRASNLHSLPHSAMPQTL